MRELDDIADSMDISMSKLWEIVNDRGNLFCCSSWGLKELDMTEWLDNNSVALNMSLKDVT